MTFTFTQGGAGRPLSENASFGMAYNAHYAPNGALCSLYSNWSLTFVHNYTFNNRFQPAANQDMYIYDVQPPAPCSVSTSPTVRDQLNLTYSYVDASSHNNGNVQQIANNLNSGGTQIFSYDSLNRLATARTAVTNQPRWQGDTPLVYCWGEQYGYDPWGNMSSISPYSSAYTGCTQESGFSMFPTTKNQLQDTNNDYVYDAAGNLTQPGPSAGAYTFDAENHLISAGGMAYLYDGDGKRVGKAPSSTPTQPNYLYWYGGGSDILEETDGAGNMFYQDFYFNGMRVDRRESDNQEDHFFLDALGNVRCVYGDSDPDGGCSDYYPFGGERPVTNGGVNVSFKFTSKERDSESGLDNFGARYNSSSLGRFLSPDKGSFHPEDPQSLNRYALALNNPLRYIDSDGNEVVAVGTYVLTTYTQLSEEIGAMDWLFAIAAGSRLGAGYEYADSWKKSVGVGQDPVRFAKESHPAELPSSVGAYFRDYSTLWSVEVDFREDPGAGMTAAISFVKNRNGVIPNTTGYDSFRTEDLARAEVSLFNFHLQELSADRVSALASEALRQWARTGDPRYLEILLAAQAEQARRAEERKKKERDCQKNRNACPKFDPAHDTPTPQDH